jgi:peptidoglycan hydrolase CwlO-like protein
MNLTIDEKNEYLQSQARELWDTIHDLRQRITYQEAKIAKQASKINELESQLNFPSLENITLLTEFPMGV